MGQHCHEMSEEFSYRGRGYLIVRPKMPNMTFLATLVDRNTQAEIAKANPCGTELFVR